MQLHVYIYKYTLTYFLYFPAITTALLFKKLGSVYEGCSKSLVCVCDTHSLSLSLYIYIYKRVVFVLVCKYQLITQKGDIIEH